MTPEKRSWKVSVRVFGGGWMELCTIASEEAPEFRLYVPDGVAPPTMFPFSMVWTEEGKADDIKAFVAAGVVRDA